MKLCTWIGLYGILSISKYFNSDRISLLVKEQLYRCWYAMQIHYINRHVHYLIVSLEENQLYNVLAGINGGSKHWDWKRIPNWPRSTSEVMHKAEPYGSD